MSTFGTGTFGDGRFGDPEYVFVDGKYKRLAWKVRWDEGYEGKIGFAVPEVENMRYAAPQMEQGELPTAFALNPDDLLPGRVEGGGGLGHIAAETIVAEDIQSNTITANQIAANTITAAELNVAELSAITANLGDITAGLITLDGGLTGLGGLIQTSEDDPKVTFDDRGLIKTSADASIALSIGPEESLQFGPPIYDAQDTLVDDFSGHSLGDFSGGGTATIGEDWEEQFTQYASAEIWGSPKKLGYNNVQTAQGAASGIYKIDLGNLVEGVSPLSYAMSGTITFDDMYLAGHNSFHGEAVRFGFVYPGTPTYIMREAVTATVTNGLDDNIYLLVIYASGSEIKSVHTLFPISEVLNSAGDDIHIDFSMSVTITRATEDINVALTDSTTEDVLAEISVQRPAVVRESGEISVLVLSTTSAPPTDPVKNSIGISSVNLLNYNAQDDRRITWTSDRSPSAPLLDISAQELTDTSETLPDMNMAGIELLAPDSTNVGSALRFKSDPGGLASVNVEAGGRSALVFNERGESDLRAIPIAGMQSRRPIEVGFNSNVNQSISTNGAEVYNFGEMDIVFSSAGAWNRWILPATAIYAAYAFILWNGQHQGYGRITRLKYGNTQAGSVTLAASYTPVQNGLGLWTAHSVSYAFRGEEGAAVWIEVNHQAGSTFATAIYDARLAIVALAPSTGWRVG